MGDGRLPAGAGDLVPGAALAAVLESVDVGGLDDPDLVGLLQAQSRQLAHVQGQVWAVMAELARRDPMPLLGGEPLQAHELFDLVVDEVRAELMLTRAAARVEVEAAVGLAALPAVAEALGLGLIDRRRALVFTDACWDLRPEHAEQVVAALLPEAMSVTATGLAARVARAVIELDPGWAERRYREALRSRKVVAYLGRDGSAVITASGLPADEAAVAAANLEAVASAAKRAGAAAGMDLLRAEVFVGLLDGRWNGWTRDQVVAELLALHPKPADLIDDAEVTGDGEGVGGSSSRRGGRRRPRRRHDRSHRARGRARAAAAPEGAADAGAADIAVGDEAASAADADAVTDSMDDVAAATATGVAGGAPAGVEVEPEAGISEDSGDPPRSPGRVVPAESRRSVSAHIRPGEAADDGEPTVSASGPPGGPPTGPPGPSDPHGPPESLGPPGDAPSPSAGVRPGVHISVGLGTLLGLDDRPGEVAGWGPVPASVARALVARQQRCAWRFGVHDEGGWLVFDGLTRRRAMPAGAVPLGADAGADAGSRGAEGGPTGGGAPKVDGVVEIHLPLDWVNAGGGSPFVLPTSVSDPSGWTAVLADIAGQVATAGPIVQDAAARFPGRPLRRRTEMVYRWCLFPGCRRPARWCDIDHRTEWARGGRTVEINLGPECRHDHVNKSERGWRLIRTGPRSFCWISPYRRRHHVQAPRLVEPALTPPRTPGPGATTRSGAGQDGIDGSDGYDGSGPAVNPAGEPSIWAHDVPADGGRRSTVDGAEPGRPTAEREVDDEAAPF